MKKSGILLFIIFAFCVSVYAQKQNTISPVQVPVDSITKLITYEGVTEVPGLKADVLYKRAVLWFRTYYKNPTDVIRENDSLKFKITGKHRFRINNLPDKEGIKTDGGLVQYTITVAAKDGRFKYEITEFNWKQQSYYACERWMDTKSQTYTTVYAEYLRQLDQFTIDLIKDLRNAVMNAKPVKDKDNW
ncbi:MAG: DUF4468 domain-containing protein [Bacteroidetes bacterium]|nr:DUF4468 domain-containing protein [Bacteroidota bacterium]